MKKLVSLILALALVISASVTVNAAQTYQQIADEAANICYDLELIVGTGDGLTPAYLGSTPKRYGGAKLICGLRGVLSEAEVFPFVENFLDYEDLLWTGGQHILGYLKAHPEVGYNGKPGNIFDPNANMSVKEYYKIMLVSLGYEENADFSWGGSDTMPDVMSMATQSGLVLLSEAEAFTMEKMCVATVEALRATMKGSTMTLADYLVAEGAIDGTVCFNYGLIPEDPNAEDPSVDADLEVTVTNDMESDVVAGDTVLTLTLTGTTFIEGLGDDNVDTTALIAGIASTPQMAVNFEDQVTITHADVERTSDTVVTIELPASATYSIDSNETVEVVVDQSLTVDEVSGVLQDTFVINAEAETPAVSLTVSNNLPYEMAVITGSPIITLELTNGTFVAGLGNNNANTTALIDGIDGALDTAVSFDAEVDIDHTNVTRLTDTLITVTLPASEDYRIGEDEEVTVTIDPSLIQEAPDAAVSDSFTIFDSGAGTVEAPWIILRTGEMDFLAANPDLYYELGADLDYGDATISPYGTFTGTLDGNNYSIKNFNIESGEFQFGFFESIVSGTVKDVVFDNANLLASLPDSGTCGVLAGVLNGGTVEGVTVQNSVLSSALNAGGIIGLAGGDGGTVRECQTSNVTISDTTRTGGIVGIVTLSTDVVYINDCNVDDFVGEGTDAVGGILGSAYMPVEIDGCIASVDLLGNVIFFPSASYGVAGGIIGDVKPSGTAVVTDSNSYGELSAGYSMGGIVGKNEGDVTLTDNYSGISKYIGAALYMNITEIAGARRILGVDDGTSDLDNVGYKDAVQVISGSEYKPWVSDAAGQDGSDSLIFTLPPDIFVIPQQDFVVPWLEQIDEDDLMQPIDPGFFIPIPGI